MFNKALKNYNINIAHYRVICPVSDEIHQAFSLQDFYKQGTLQSDYLKENIFLN